MRSLQKLEKQLKKVRGEEYSLPFGSMARAKVSRKWDELAKEKMRIKNELREDIAMLCLEHMADGYEDLADKIMVLIDEKIQI